MTLDSMDIWPNFSMKSYSTLFMINTQKLENSNPLKASGTVMSTVLVVITPNDFFRSYMLILNVCRFSRH